MELWELAVENVIKIEVKKDGLTQRQNGDWQLRFTAQEIDADQRIVRAPMGTRFQCYLVEVNDDETPVDFKGEERGKWAELGPTKQAALRCKQPVFWAYLREGDYKRRGVRNEETAAIAVRDICEVTSRSELSKPGKQRERVLWHQLDNQFQAWKAKEHA
jgi:hypothetical protein